MLDFRAPDGNACMHVSRVYNQHFNVNLDSATKSNQVLEIRVESQRSHSEDTEKVHVKVYVGRFLADLRPDSLIMISSMLISESIEK